MLNIMYVPAFLTSMYIRARETPTNDRDLLKVLNINLNSHMRNLYFHNIIFYSKNFLLDKFNCLFENYSTLIGEESIYEYRVGLGRQHNHIHAES